MDYFGILKKAWNITWKYKMLWVLGLFVGAGSSSSSSGGSNYSSGSSDFSGSGTNPFVGMERWFADNLLLVAIIAGVLVVIGLIFWVVSIAAQGGLIYGANEAAEGRTPSLRDCWGVGFRKWGRTFMVYLVAMLPILAVGAVMTVLLIGMAGGGVAAGDEGAVIAALGGVCILFPLMGFIILVLGVILGIVIQLALRYGVLDDVTFGQAIKRGWNDLWAKQGAFVMFLVMILPGIAYGFATLIVVLPFAIIAVALLLAEQYVMTAAVFVLMILVLMLPGAVYGTFVSSAWTIFFRQMTGREPKTASVPATPPGYVPPPAPYGAPVPPVAEPVVAADAPIVDVAPVAAVMPEAVPAEEASVAEGAPPAEEAPPADV